MSSFDKFINPLSKFKCKNFMHMNSSWQLNEYEKPFNIKHRCFAFSKAVIFFVKECRYERINYSLFDQLVRSATSIGANVVEGGSGSSLKDLKRFYVIALKSANETKYWLCLIRDTTDVSRDLIKELIKEADEISRIIASIILKINRSSN